jgi:hypothetical protein
MADHRNKVRGADGLTVTRNGTACCTQALLEQRKLKVEGMLHGLSATAEEMQSELTRMESAATLDVRVLEMTSFPPAPPPTDAASSRPGTAASASTAVSHL